jgi:DNA polymerase I-like protein with 3'-5' exonuclease and polymerase domains
VLEAPKEEIEETAKVVVKTMADAAKLKVPLAAEVSIGDNWEEMTDLKI